MNEELGYPLGESDPMKWAEEFCRCFNGQLVTDAKEGEPEHYVDPALMVGWFANAFTQGESGMPSRRTAANPQRPTRKAARMRGVRGD